MFGKAIRQLAILGVLFSGPAILRAGANTWTGSRPAGTADGVPALVSASLTEPDVVFGSIGRVLYRSADGGRTWARIREFREIRALLVHPASPEVVYVADEADGASAVHVTRDAGETWTTTLSEYSITMLAGSPTDSSTVFAGGWSNVYKSTDSGASWQQANFIGLVASLVLDPHDESIAYAGGEGAEYPGWSDYPGSFGKSTDGGGSWTNSDRASIDNVFAVAVDPVAGSTVYVATGPYRDGGGLRTAPEVLRSDDGGDTWTAAGPGLPAAAVRALVVDPLAPGILYAGTDAGIFRSRDGGRSWTAFSQQLAGTAIRSLTISGSGRRLHAATSRGIFELEIARGPLDVDAAGSGASRVLAVDGDRVSINTLDVSGAWAGGALRAAPGWTAVAIADAGEGHHRVLWQAGDGRASLEFLGPSGRQSAVALVVEGLSGWIPRDLSVSGDGRNHVLWTGLDGRMFISTMSASGASTVPQTYGPWGGWSAVAIADAASGETWVLWRCTDGRASLSVHRNGLMASVRRLGAHLDWSAEDLTIGADGRPRLLRTSPSGLASVVTIDEHGLPVAGARYTLPGFTPRRIAAGADGLTRLLFSSDDGQGEVLLLDANNQPSAKKSLHPLASVVVTSSAELEAAMTPENAGKQILVRAGEYEVGSPLTVPERATVVGEGEMLFDDSGMPQGFEPAGRTLIRSAPGFIGDVLTLGNGATLRGLVVEMATDSTGNAIVAYSRAPGDFVSANVTECEIVNPNPPGIRPSGPIGAALVALTRNLNLGQDPPAHDGADIRLEMRRSRIISAAGGTGVFAINFAAHAAIRLVLERNVIGGGLISTGGVSRPDAVTGSRVTIDSRGNLYSNEAAIAGALGWNLIGGAGSPAFPSAASTENQLRLHSNGDAIDGFQLGILAIGGQRFLAADAPSSSNLLDLNLHGLRVRTTTESGAADLLLFGARSLVAGEAPGDGNVLHLVVTKSNGSGLRANAYADSVDGPGAGNRLEIVGSPTSFAATNGSFEPPPPDEFFESE